MKKTLLILIAALVSLPAIAQDRALKPVSSNQLEGTWYGLYMGSQASVTFNIDNTFAISNEAFSQMNMAGAYVLDGNSLSLGGIPGMEGKGLVSVEGDKMYLLVVFGAQGMVKAPVSFNDGIGNPAAMQLRLSRDKKVIDQATTRIDAPASAALAASSSTSMLPWSSQPTRTMSKPAIAAEAGLVPWAEVGMIITRRPVPPLALR